MSLGLAMAKKLIRYASFTLEILVCHSPPPDNRNYRSAMIKSELRESTVKCAVNEVKLTRQFYDLTTVNLADPF